MKVSTENFANFVTLIRKFPGVVIFGILCLLSIWIWVPEVRTHSPVTATPTSDLSERLKAGQRQLAALIPVTAERPLFQASRQPLAEPEEPVAAPPPEPTLTLVGILSDQGNQIALLRISNSAELYRMEAGSRLARWRVMTIGGEFVEVSKDGGEPFKLTIDG